jgi:hypothetical protein
VSSVEPNGQGRWINPDAPTGVSGRTALLVVLATLLTILLIYELVVWQPVPGVTGQPGSVAIHQM